MVCRIDIGSALLASAANVSTSPCQHDIAARASSNIVMLKNWLFASAELTCSNRNVGGGAWCCLASSIIAALNSSQVAAARAVIGDNANIAPIANVHIRMKHLTATKRPAAEFTQPRA